ncbi:MAG: DUF6110 family protein [Eubacteriales bacterium]
MWTFIRQTPTLIFLGGAAVGAFGLKILKSDAVHNVAVATLAKGYQIKDIVMEEANNLRQEAEDICAEAKAKSECCCETCECVEETDEV